MVQIVPGAGTPAPGASSNMKISPARYIEKPGLGRAGAAAITAAPPPEITVDPGTAVLLKVYATVQLDAPPVGVKGWSGWRLGSFSGNTQAKSSTVRLAGRASAEPATLVLA